MFFLIFSITMLVIGLLLIVFIYIQSNRAGSSKGRNLVKTVKFKKSLRAKLYQRFTKVPLLGDYLENIKEKLYYSNPSFDEYRLRARTVSVVMFSISVSLLALILFYRMYGTDTYTRLTMLVLCVFLNNIIIEKSIGNRKDKLLNHLPESINDLKQQYHMYKMVDIAILEAAKKAKPDVAPRFYEIYNIFKSNGPKEELHKFYENCKDKFLKIIAGFSYLVMEYGDKKINGTSLYIKNLNHIMEEINMEKVKRMKLNFYMKWLPIIVVIPIFFPPFFAYWVKSNFAGAASFYDSSVAFFVKNLIIFIIFICYLLITQFKNSSSTVSFKTTGDILDYKMIKIPLVKLLVCTVMPGKNSMRLKKLKGLIEDAGSPLNEECVYFRRILTGIFSLLIIIAIFYTGHRINVRTIMDNPAYGIENNNIYNIMGNLHDNPDLKPSDINKFDAEMIRYLGGVKQNGDSLKEAIKSKIIEAGYKNEDIQIVTERVYKKMTDSQKEYIRFWELLLSLLIAFGCSFIPIGMLHFQRTLRLSEMQDEIFQFHTIIILLMYHENTSVKVILEWMIQFGNCFKVPLIRCLNNFHDPDKALDELKKDVRNKEFKNIVDNLKMATNKLEIRDAFDSLEIDREFYKDSRKELNEQNVARKVSMGKNISFIPLYMTLFLYLILPLLMTSLMGMKDLLKQFSTIKQ